MMGSLGLKWHVFIAFNLAHNVCKSSWDSIILDQLARFANPLITLQTQLLHCQRFFNEKTTRNLMLLSASLQDFLPSLNVVSLFCIVHTSNHKFSIHASFFCKRFKCQVVALPLVIITDQRYFCIVYVTNKICRAYSIHFQIWIHSFFRNVFRVFLFCYCASMG